MRKNALLRAFTVILATLMLLSVLGCNSVYDINDSDMDSHWDKNGNGGKEETDAPDRPADDEGVEGEDEVGGDEYGDDEEEDENAPDTPDGEKPEDSDNQGGNNEGGNNQGGNNQGGNNQGGNNEGGSNEGLLDFEGQRITVLCRNSVESSREWYKEAPEDELDEVIAIRNSRVENELNLKVGYHFINDTGYDRFAAAFNREILNDVANDFHQYDVAANFGYAGAYKEVRDLAANLLDKEAFPYFDFDVDCWSRSIIENTTFNGRLHYITGALNLSAIDSAMLLWYNEDYYNSKREEGDPEDLMQYALDGNWTFTDLYKIAASVSYETDGFYSLSGAVYRNPIPCDLLPIAWEVDLVVENDDGTHAFNIENNDKISGALQRYQQLASLGGSSTQNGAAGFAAGEYMFRVGAFFESAASDMALREMSAAHSFLPWPKYDQNQKEYHTTSRDYHTLITVIDHSESTFKTRGEAVSAYLQLAQEYSYSDVLPVYKTHRVTKSSNLADHDKVGSMYDLIVNSIKYDFRTIYSPQLNNITWLWRDNMTSAEDIVNKFINNREIYEQAIYDTDRWLGVIQETPAEWQE